MSRPALSVFLAVSALGLPWPLFGAKPRAVLIGVHPWIGYETLCLAREFGWLPVQVVLCEGATAADSLAGLQAGTLDGAALTRDEALLARTRGVPLTAVAVFDVSAGADGVLARPELQALRDLAGRRIAFERSTVGERMLHRLLGAAGPTVGEVFPMDLPPSRQLDAWRSGLVDAVVTYEPTASQLKREGAPPIFDSRRIPDTIFAVLVARSDRLRAAYCRGLAHVRVSRQDAVCRIATRQHMAADEVQRALAGVTLPSLSGNQRYLEPGSRLDQAARGRNESMAAGRLPRPDSLSRLFDPAYLPSGRTLEP